jgi:2-isopropylmalate synthase
MFDLLVRHGLQGDRGRLPVGQQTDFDFVRELIEEDLIPDDVTIQVLTQARDHLIERTFESIRGAKQAIVHLYNSTSVLQRASSSASTGRDHRHRRPRRRLCRSTPRDDPRDRRVLRVLPESYTGTELEFAVEVCNAVIDVWQPTPTARSSSTCPPRRDGHPERLRRLDRVDEPQPGHRDSIVCEPAPAQRPGHRVAAAELGYMAGADRIEGCLFGNGERTGNVCLVTLG